MQLIVTVKTNMCAATALPRLEPYLQRLARSITGTLRDDDAATSLAEGTIVRFARRSACVVFTVECDDSRTRNFGDDQSANDIQPWTRQFPAEVHRSSPDAARSICGAPSARSSLPRSGAPGRVSTAWNDDSSPWAAVALAIGRRGLSAACDDRHGNSAAVLWNTGCSSSPRCWASAQDSPKSVESVRSLDSRIARMRG